MRVFFSKLFIFCLCLVMAGCNDEGNQETSIPVLLSAAIESVDGSESTRLKGGESVGLWISTEDPQTLSQSDVLVHGKFFQSAGGLVTEPRLVWKDHQTLSITGYYPYENTYGASPEQSVFRVKCDQTATDSIVASDLLWTKARISRPTGENQPATLPFSHLCTQLIINVKGSHPEIGSFRNSRVRIVGTTPTARANLLTGTLTAEGAPEEILSTPLTSIAEGYEASSQVVLVPQTIRSTMPLLQVITTGNVENEWTPEQDIVLEPGTRMILDVLVKEKECEVKIREITPWTTSDDILYGEAVEALPSYRLFDFYSRLGIEGIVIALDNNTDGKHGWIVSTDEAELEWLNDGSLKIFGFSTSQEHSNLIRALTADPTLEKFPAFKWCDDKNGKRTTLAELAKTGIEGRWFLPTSNRLRDLIGKKYLGYANTQALEQLNAAIDAASVPAAKKQHFKAADWSDYESSVGYWSSSYVVWDSYDGSHLVRSIVSSSADWLGGGTGFRVSFANGQGVQKVRAVYHF